MMMNDAPTIGDRIRQLERELAAEQEKCKGLREAVDAVISDHAKFKAKYPNIQDADCIVKCYAAIATLEAKS